MWLCLNTFGKSKGAVLACAFAQSSQCLCFWCSVILTISSRSNCGNNLLSCLVTVCAATWCRLYLDPIA